MNKEEIWQKLQAPFPAVAHKQRQLPGGTNYIYLPWKTVTRRLNELCPFEWEDAYSDPAIAGDYCTVRCTLTICGVKRMALGTQRVYPELNEEGKEKIIGTPADNAAALAFQRAARKFGIGDYVDDQKWLQEYYLAGQKYRSALNQLKGRLKLSKEEVASVCSDNFEESDPLALSPEEGEHLFMLLEAFALAKSQPEGNGRSPSSEEISPSLRKALNDAMKSYRLYRGQIETLAKANNIPLNGEFTSDHLNRLNQLMEAYAKQKAPTG